MSFQVPHFNLLANTWHGNPAPPFPPGAAPDEVLVGMIAKSSFIHAFASGLNKPNILIQIWFPALTDVRGALSSTFQDVLEVPAGSGRFYQCHQVEDVGKGFPNEFRVAYCFQVQFPTPIT